MTDEAHDLDHGELFGVRLEFRDAVSAAVALDGSWWPRTRESADELTALIRALEGRHAQVRLLMLNPHGWRGHPRRIELLGRSVRIDWITTLDESIVIGATGRGTRIDLQLVVPPDADEVAAVAIVVTGPPAAAVPPDVLTAVLHEHTAIGATLVKVIEALDGFGTGAPGAWIERLRPILLALRTDLGRYHDVLRSPSATYDRVVAATPRLSNAIASLECEHQRIGGSLDRLLQCADEPPAATLHVRLRNNGLTLVRDLIRYRQQGADLLHQADEVDLGGQG